MYLSIYHLSTHLRAHERKMSTPPTLLQEYGPLSPFIATVVTVVVIVVVVSAHIRPIGASHHSITVIAR